jgi:ribonuclease VapC
MYVEPSALVAILNEEPDADALRNRLAVNATKVISVVGKVEASISMGRAMNNHELAPDLVEQFCLDAGISTVSIHADLFQDVVRAYQRYGKGTGHAAKLNFGDCFSYAFCKRHGMRLLFKGSDFSKTDVEPAL